MPESKARTDWAYDLGPGDYQLCKEALSNLSRGEADMSRVMGAFRYGGREMWGAIVELWERLKAEAGGGRP